MCNANKSIKYFLWSIVFQQFSLYVVMLFVTLLATVHWDIITIKIEKLYKLFKYYVFIQNFKILNA
jgi:hypothetical protein